MAYALYITVGVVVAANIFVLAVAITGGINRKDSEESM
jgi:hypothetical protein